MSAQRRDPDSALALAWSLADVGAVCYDQPSRRRLFVLLGAGESRRAITLVLTAMARRRMPLKGALAERVS